MLLISVCFELQLGQYRRQQGSNLSRTSSASSLFLQDDRYDFGLVKLRRCCSCPMTTFRSAKTRITGVWRT